MLTWSKDVVSDGAQGEIIPISVGLLGKMGKDFFLGNLSVYFNLHYQFLVVPCSKSLLTVSCGGDDVVCLLCSGCVGSR